jgi:hypothetical protein
MIPGPNRDKARGKWRRLHNEELYALYSSPNIWGYKSRRLRQAKRTERMGERRDTNRVLVGKPEGRNHLKDPGVDGMIILKWILRSRMGATDWINVSG